MSIRFWVGVLGYYWVMARLYEAARQDLALYQRDAWTWPIIFNTPAGTPVDITGYSAVLTIRRTDTNGVMLALSSPGDIDIGGANGTFTIRCTNAKASGLTSTGAYDLWVVPPSGAGFHLLYGDVTAQEAIGP